MVAQVRLLKQISTKTLSGEVSKSLPSLSCESDRECTSTPRYRLKNLGYAGEQPRPVKEPPGMCKIFY